MYTTRLHINPIDNTQGERSNSFFFLYLFIYFAIFFITHGSHVEPSSRPHASLPERFYEPLKPLLCTNSFPQFNNVHHTRHKSVTYPLLYFDNNMFSSFPYSIMSCNSCRYFSCVDSFMEYFCFI